MRHPQEKRAGGPAVHWGPLSGGGGPRKIQHPAKATGGSPFKVPPQSLGPLPDPPGAQATAPTPQPVPYLTRPGQAGAQKSKELSSQVEVARESWLEKTLHFKSGGRIPQSGTVKWPHFTDGKREARRSGFLCYAYAASLRAAGMSPGVPRPHPARKPQPLPKSSSTESREASAPHLSRQGADREASRRGSPALRPSLSTGSGGRAPRRTSERRGEEGRAREGGAGHSPEAAKRPGAQSSAPHSAANRRGSCIVWGCGRRAGRSGPASSRSRSSGTGINRAARHLPPAHVLRPGPPGAD